MAEVIATTVTEKLTFMLADTILQEESLVTGFKEDFEFLCSQVGSIKCLLNEVSGRTISSSMTNWIEKLEDFVEDAMDILKECRVARNPLFCMTRNPIFFYRMGRKIKKLKKRITKIHGDAQFLQYLDLGSINALVLNNSEDQRERSTSLTRESQTVGMENDMNAMIELLNEDGPRVIAVVGMGGQGKTHLAQRVFNSVHVRARFEHLVWLSVSQNFSAKQLLLDVGKQLKVDIYRYSSEEELSVRVQGQIKEKRSLFIVDDVWHTDACEKIGLTTWQGKIKIVITTRDKKVAEAMSNHQIHNMTPLTTELSRELFCIRAFPDMEKHTPPHELASIANSIVEKCFGLPLALKTVGGYMATVRRLSNDWQRALHRLNEASPRRDKVMSALRLSYEDLPSHLKACFLYCSVFPKNTDINSDYLVYAWIAQEFVSGQVPDEAYNLGRSYIDQLIDRCLMDVSLVGWDGRVKSCKMHDLLHDLALSESLNQTNCLLKPGRHIHKLPVEECRGSRRISLMKNDLSRIEENIECPGLRTLLLSYNILESISAGFFYNMRYLSVLDLSETYINSLPESVGNLKNLKFLNLNKTMVKILPESLSGLRCLHFLDVSNCGYLKRLHSGIGKHQCMLHLNMEGSNSIELIPDGISQLTSLQTLEGVVFGGGEIIGGNGLELMDLKGLRLLQHLSLTIHSLSSSKGIQLEEDIIRPDEGILGGMTRMLTLDVTNNDIARFLHLPKDMEVMQGLQIVRLRRCVVPKWIFELHNLMELHISRDSRSSADDYRGLAWIPYLRKVVLRIDYKCIEFPKEFGEPMAFPKLEWFEVYAFECLEKFPSLQENAMPMLKYLEFCACKHLKNMPAGLERLRSLQEVKVRVRLDNSHEVEDFRNAHCWQILKDRQIKINLNAYW